MPSRAARVLLALAAAVTVHAGDWPRFLGPKGDCTSAETNLVDTIPAVGLPIVFDSPVGTGYAAPSVRDGKLVLFHRLADLEVVQVLDAATGKPLWQFQTGGSIAANPISFSVSGKQRIAIATRGALVVFGLF